MRCFNIIRGLRQRGYDVGIYQKSKLPDLVVTASLDFSQWGEVYEECFRTKIPVILDLSENEFERSARVTGRKVRNFFTRLQSFAHLFSKLRGFFRRRRFDRKFYPFVGRCSALAACSRVIVEDSKLFARSSYFVPDAIDFGNYRSRTQYSDKGKPVICWLAARGRSTFSELRWYPPMEAAKGSLSWVFRAKQPESVRTGP